MSERVSFYNFAQLHHESFRTEILQRIQKIIEDGSFIDGSYNKAFEAQFRDFCQAKHCLLVANGTDALELALVAHGIGHGDLVGVPGITFYATAEAVQTVGATPILIDVDPTTGLIAPKSLERLLERYPLKAILPVHIYGLPAPIAELEAICKPRNITIIEDAAQAHDATLLDGRRVGGSGNTTTFSFYPTKNLSAFGDAGAITTGDGSTNERLQALRNHGRSPQGLQFFGRNSRCDHINAAVLELKLQSFSKLQSARRQTAACYHNAFASLPLVISGRDFLAHSSWHLYPILLADAAEKAKMMAHLSTHQIDHMNFYQCSLGEEIPLRNADGERTEAARFASRVITLPIHPFLSESERSRVIEVVSQFFLS